MEKKPISIRYADELDAHNVTRASLATAESKIAELSASVAAKNAELSALSAQMETVKTESAAKQSEDAAQIADLSAKLDESTAKLSDATAKLALSPAHKDISAGTVPVNASIEGGNDVSDWSTALAACNGDYVEARRKFPKQYEAFMKRGK